MIAEEKSERLSIKAFIGLPLSCGIMDGLSFSNPSIFFNYFYLENIHIL